MPDRAETLQSFLDLYDKPSYLEIGVQNGVTFHQIKAGRKVAVDPKFQFPTGDREPSSEYYEITSDAYFSSLNAISSRFDVIFLDGLHTFEQTLRDLLNAINYITLDGIIVVDDVVPSSYHASLPDTSEFARVWEAVDYNGSVNWMGDVYKLVFFIETFLPSFVYATTSDNHGQTAIWRGDRTPAYKTLRTMETINRMEFKHTILLNEQYNKLSLPEILAFARRDITTIRSRLLEANE